MDYRNLIKDNQQKKVWKYSFANELDILAQGGLGKIVKGTHTIFFVDYKDIPIERRKGITYGRIVVDYRPQK